MEEKSVEVKRVDSFVENYESPFVNSDRISLTSNKRPLLNFSLEDLNRPKVVDLTLEDDQVVKSDNEETIQLEDFDEIVMSDEEVIRSSDDEVIKSDDDEIDKTN